MAQPVIALGLDSAEPLLLERWMQGGYLPNLSRLRRAGGYGRLRNRVQFRGAETDYYHTEPSWVSFLTGCQPETTGYWDIVTYDPETYSIDSARANRTYDFREHPSFFALGEAARVALFDVPDWVPSEKVNGPQVMGWGGHFSTGEIQSLPRNFLSEINEKHGKCNVLDNDHGAFWDRKYLSWLSRELAASAGKRASIYKDLLKREPWDLFMGFFCELHSAGHDFWFLSQPDHPLHFLKEEFGIQGDPQRDAYVAVDEAIGQVLDAADPDAAVFCFSVHGMGENMSDLLSMLVLPELLYRYNFPGRVGVAPGESGVEPGAPITSSRRKSWSGELWSRAYEPSSLKRALRSWTPGRALKTAANDDLLSPMQGTPGELPWMPGAWYRRTWPKSRAFAMPAFSMGHIRINVKGRESGGTVAPEDYDAVCEEVSAFLHRLTDARSGEPVVKEVLRTRHTPLDNDPTLPVPDLVVSWRMKAVDVVDSPDVGRIGPVPYMRTGSHRPHGFIMGKGPGITPGSEFPAGRPVDLAPTILDIMGVKDRPKMDGLSLLRPAMIAAE